MSHKKLINGSYSPSSSSFWLFFIFYIINTSPFASLRSMLLSHSTTLIKKGLFNNYKQFFFYLTQSFTSSFSTLCGKRRERKKKLSPQEPPARWKMNICLDFVKCPYKHNQSLTKKERVREKIIPLLYFIVLLTTKHSTNEPTNIVRLNARCSHPCVYLKDLLSSLFFLSIAFGRLFALMKFLSS